MNATTTHYFGLDITFTLEGRTARDVEIAIDGKKVDPRDPDFGGEVEEALDYLYETCGADNVYWA